MKITELREQPHLSAAGINDYLECGLLLKFSRIDRLRPESYPDSLVLGQAVHRVLADFYQKLRAGTRLAQKHLEEAFDYPWEELAHGRGDITYKPGKSFHTYRHISRKILDDFPQVFHEVARQQYRQREQFWLSLKSRVLDPLSTIDAFGRQFQLTKKSRKPWPGAGCGNRVRQCFMSSTPSPGALCTTAWPPLPATACKVWAA
jgi:hypothetical protein